MHSHADCITERVYLIHTVLFSTDRQLTAPQALRLWGSLAELPGGDPGGAESGVALFQRFCFSVPARPLLALEAVEAVLEQKLTALRLAAVTGPAWACFRTSFFFVAAKRGNVEDEPRAGGGLRTVVVSTTRSLEDMKGLPFLWELATSCPHEETAAELRALLVSLHTQLAAALRPQAERVRALFVDECGRRLDRAAAVVIRKGPDAQEATLVRFLRRGVSAPLHAPVLRVPLHVPLRACNPRASLHSTTTQTPPANPR